MTTTYTLRAGRFLWLVVAATSVLSQESPVKFCLKDEDKTRPVNVTLTCSPGTVMSVGKAFFGRSQWGLCKYTDGDCIVEIDSFGPCNGKRNCTHVFTGIYTKQCGYSTFLTVIYDCIGGVPRTPPPPGNQAPVPGSDNRHQTPTPSVPRHVLRVASWDPVVTPKNNDDTALIAGCAVAIVVTVTVLIIAIILVVRRLIWIRHESNNQSPKKRSAISVLICTKLGCAMASCHEPEPEDGGSGQAATPEQEDEDEGRVTPLGADAVEEVNELGGPDVTSEVQVPTTSSSAHHLQSVQRDSRVQSGPSQGITPEDSSSRSSRQMNSAVNNRMDAVALPNTELSTLC